MFLISVTSSICLRCNIKILHSRILQLTPILHATIFRLSYPCVHNLTVKSFARITTSTSALGMILHRSQLDLYCKDLASKSGRRHYTSLESLTQNSKTIFGLSNVLTSYTMASQADTLPLYLMENLGR